MKRNLITVLAILLAVSACGAPVPPPPPATETASPPTETAIPPTATLEPSPTPDPLLFRDEFDGALGDGWHWVREKPSDWSLTKAPGWIEIMARAGGVGDGSISNLLLREAPTGDFELETRLNFRPAGNFQLGGLLIYADNTDYVVFGRAFCAGGACAGDGLYMDMIIDGNWNSENFATRAPAVDILHLRLRRVGDAYSGSVSEDGQQWTVIGSHQAPWQPVFIGILAGQAVRSVPKPAQFDYFMVTAIP